MLSLCESGALTVLLDCNRVGCASKRRPAFFGIVYSLRNMTCLIASSVTANERTRSPLFLVRYNIKYHAIATPGPDDVLRVNTYPSGSCRSSAKSNQWPISDPSLCRCTGRDAPPIKPAMASNSNRSLRSVWRSANGIEQDAAKRQHTHRRKPNRSLLDVDALNWLPWISPIA